MLMEIKTIIYVIIAIVYVIFSIYRNIKKASKANPKPQSQPRTTNTKSDYKTTQKPKKKKPFSLGDFIEEIEEVIQQHQEVPKAKKKKKKKETEKEIQSEPISSEYIPVIEHKRPVSSFQAYKEVNKTNPYRKYVKNSLKRPTDVKKAILLSEIIQRKHF